MISLVMLLLKKVPVIMAELREARLAVDLAAVRVIRLEAVSRDLTVMVMDIMSSTLKMEKTWMIY